MLVDGATRVQYPYGLLDDHADIGIIIRILVGLHYHKLYKRLQLRVTVRAGEIGRF